MASIYCKLTMSKALMMKMQKKNKMSKSDSIPPHMFMASGSPRILKLGEAPNMSKFVKNCLSIIQ